MTKELKCGRNKVLSEIGEHYKHIFQGSYEPVEVIDPLPPAVIQGGDNSNDHNYSSNPQAKLPNIDDSSNLDLIPNGWLNREFSVKEVVKIVRRFKNCNAEGWDSIPNEALNNTPDDFYVLLTRIYNCIKRTGKMPKGWNRGLIPLVHKKGKHDSLYNYRPLTVIISLCGLYSKVLNERLWDVVEHHKLL